MRLNQVLGVLPHLNLSEEVEQREKDLRVGGGQFDLFYGYSRRHRQHVAIRRLRIHLELGPHAANVSGRAGSHHEQSLV